MGGPHGQADRVRRHLERDLPAGRPAGGAPPPAGRPTKTEQIRKEHAWLPSFAPSLPLEIPVPLALGEPAEDFPSEWTVCDWLGGEEAAFDRLDDPCEDAVALARFIAGLQAIDPAGSPAPGRTTSSPATELLPAWNLFEGESREVFRTVSGVDDATWARGRGLALTMGLIALPYYLETNPVIVGWARRIIAEVLADHERQV